MENKEIVKTKDKSIIDIELIKKAQQLAGQSQGTIIPFIPIVKINNKTEKKMAIIEGVETEVKVPAKQGFNILRKLEGNYVEDFWKGDINGVVLKERFMIEKKFNPESKEIQYKSNEFDDWNEQIELYDKMNKKNIIVEGTYTQLKEKYTTISIDKEGQKKEIKDFSLFVILYINLNMTGEVYRMKLKVTGGENWFTYKNTFSENEPWTGIITHFNLKQKTIGDILFWYVKFQKGEQVDLAEQIKLQLEINKYFIISKEVYSKPKENYDNNTQETNPSKQTIYLNNQLKDSEGLMTEDNMPLPNNPPPTKDDEEISIEEIPF